KIMACPSFENVIVTRSHPPRPRARKLSLDGIPEPVVRSFEDTWNIFVSGVGGMGVGVTASTLARAGTRAGYNVRFNDKKGLAIRNGAVSAHISFGKGGAKISTIVPNGKADLLLGIDMLEAERSLLYASRARTTAVVNSSKVPTIPMLAGMMNYPPDVEENIRKHTDSDNYFGARIGEISELVFGNKLFSNTIMLGVAFQKGLIPVGEQDLVDSIFETVSPKQRPKNMEAFRLGRKLVTDPSLLDLTNIVADPKILTAFGATEDYKTILEKKTESLKHAYWQWWKGRTIAKEYRALVEATVTEMGLDDETNKHLARRVYDLITWDGLPYARRFVDRVQEVFRLDRVDRGYPATKAVIRNLHKVMAVKDEFYTAHLLTDDEKLDRDKVRYNIDEENGDRISYVHINEPEFNLFGKQIRFDLPNWLARNWFYNIGKRAGFARKMLSRWGWHQKEHAFRDWYYNDVIGFYLATAHQDYDWALRGLRVLNDPYRPDEFIVTGFREVVYPKMDRAREQFELIRGTSPGRGDLPVMPPTIAVRPE
ncbi:MAG TPA: 2-oxoacid:acceptor oxidoreductase family protein, partial [Candidatus Binatus sp.]|nr:2-oxoacid:acceptor oxidoreductase family protein [Candidatus Binatus sp.]